MAPVKPTRTYSRNNRSVISTLDIFTKVITKKQQKRKNKKKKLNIKELPPRNGKNLLENDSIEVSLENTFDKLLKGEKYNNVKINSNVINIDDESSEVLLESGRSNVKEINTVVHSPVITRYKLRKNKICDNLNYSKSNYTMPESKSTINDSLSVEVIRDNIEFPSLSYIHLTDKDTKRDGLLSIKNSLIEERNVSQMLTNSLFFDKIMVHSSTPACSVKHRRVVCDTISPIKNNSTTNCDEVKSIINNDENQVENVESKQNEEKTSNPSNDSFITLRRRKVRKINSSSLVSSRSNVTSKREVENKSSCINISSDPPNFVTERKKCSKELSDDKIMQSKELLINLTNCNLNSTPNDVQYIENNIKDGRELVINVTKLDFNDKKSNKSDSNIYLSDNISINNDERTSQEDLITKELIIKLPRLQLNATPNSPETKSEHSIPDIIESSQTEEFMTGSSILPKRHLSKTLLVLRAGKSWRRSLSTYRRSVLLKGILGAGCRNSASCEPSCNTCGISSLAVRLSNKRKSAARIVPAAPPGPHISVLGSYAHSRLSEEEAGYEPSESRRRRDATEPGLVAEEKVGDVYEVAKGQHSVIYEVEEEQKSVYEGCEERGSFRGAQVALTAREVVLRRCGQDEPLAFEECYPDSRLEHCQKIGEGVYGEVFLLREPKTGTTTVVKVIPIEGEALVNGERQKRFDEVLSEIVITTELSALRHGKEGNRTAAFAEVKSVRCAYGRYPPRLLELWELYDETKGSENDSPELFGEEQLYIVLELANGGKDLEAFVLEDAQQAYSVFKQVACALAVAETALSFEHRDLHWGNILISTVDKRQKVNFNLDGHEIEVSTNGVLVTIIDFTLSRMECDGVVLYDDLERDEELFSAEGDYQFEVYRLMRACTGGAWRAFAPKTNLLWLHYVLDKATGGALRFRAPRAKRRHLAMLGAFQAEVLKYEGAADFVRDRF